MLVISRRPHEAFVLTLPDGRVVRVIVCEIDHTRVRIAIDAPKDVVILRAELTSPTARDTPQG